jgi:methyl-accepting chemotaxis protein
MTSNIATAANQQSIAATDIDRSVSSIATNSVKTAEITSQLRTTAINLEKNTLALEHVTKELKA